MDDLRITPKNAKILSVSREPYFPEIFAVMRGIWFIFVFRFRQLSSLIVKQIIQ